MKIIKEGNQEEPQTEGKPWFPCGSGIMPKLVIEDKV